MANLGWLALVAIQLSCEVETMGATDGRRGPLSRLWFLFRGPDPPRPAFAGINVAETSFGILTEDSGG
jgi:hypothetical protein